MSKKLTVLFVDDDAHVLASLLRTFRKQPLTTLTATSAEQACDILSETPVDVVVSDMKMPEATGTDLMHWVLLNQPHVYRIILSGYSCLDDAINAINLGKVHRFIEKPWDNQELIKAVLDGVESSQNCNENPKKLTQAEDAKRKLKCVSQALSKKLEQKSLHVQQVFNWLKEERQHSEMMLNNVIDICPMLDKQCAVKTTKLAMELAQLMGLSHQQKNTLNMASTLSQIGLLGVNPSIVETPFECLTGAEREAFFQQIYAVSAVLLTKTGPKTSLAHVQQVLIQQFERWDGQGFPAKKQAEGICIEARIFAIARDFWRYVDGKICAQKLDLTAALQKLVQSANSKYDPYIIELLNDHFETLVLDIYGGKLISSELQPDMVLSQAIHTSANMTLLPAGHVFTQDSIRKIKDIETRQKTRFVFEITSQMASDIKGDVELESVM